MATAQQALRQGTRREAVHALDAAMRAAEVDTHAAQRHLEAAVATLEAATQAAPTEQTALPQQATWSAYEDAVLLNALGIRIGEVVRLQATASGAAEAVLALGGGPPPALWQTPDDRCGARGAPDIGLVCPADRKHHASCFSPPGALARA